MSRGGFQLAHARGNRRDRARVAQDSAIAEIRSAKAVVREAQHAFDLARVVGIIEHPEYREHPLRFWENARSWLEEGKTRVLGAAHRMAMARVEHALNARKGLRAKGGTPTAFVPKASARKRTAHKPKRAALPAWMADTSLLPKDPPGRVKAE